MSSKIVILVILAAVLTGGMLYKSLSSHTTNKVFSRKLMETFNRWKQVHGRLYASPAENDFRLSVFVNELEFVERKNKEYDAIIASRGEKLSGPMFEMNKFGDLTKEEFVTSYTGIAPISSEFIAQPVMDENNLPKSTQKKPLANLGDIRFTPTIRNQGGCGGCWAFSAVIELERKIWANGGHRVDLSQQELIDCVTDSNGCSGGHPEAAYDYARANGLRTANVYPYVAAKSACNNKVADPFTFTDLVEKTDYLGFTNERSQKASDEGVMPAVLVHATGAFRYLSKIDDVYDASTSGECGNTVNHGITQWLAFNGVVTIVNSYGFDWGYYGYKRIKPCDDKTFWGAHGRLAIPYGY